MKRITGILFFIQLALFSRADSPLTSTTFCKAYDDIALIKKTMLEEKSVLNSEHLAFFDNATIPLDQKVALINALGWGDTVKTTMYIAHLAAKYKIPSVVFDSILTWRGSQPNLYSPAAAISAEDLCCLAYMQAMGNYFAPIKGYYCAYQAANIKPQSEAVSYVYGLILAQFYLDNDWCQVYKIMEAVRDFDAYSTDRLREAAIANIFEYITLYKESCDPNGYNPFRNAEIIKPETLGEHDYNKPTARLMRDGKKYADLKVIKFEIPEYDENIKGAIIRVKVKNTGNMASVETNAKLYDLDIDKEEAKRRKLTKSQISAIEENLLNREDKTQTDPDPYFESFSPIPGLQPGAEIEIIFKVKDNWFYDPNCEIEVILDFHDNIEEKNEKDNRKEYVAWG